MVKTKPVSLTKEEVEKIVDCSFTDEHDYLFLRMLRKTGRRLEEIYSITVGDFNPIKKEIMIKVLKRKDDQLRPVFLDDTTSLLLKKYIQTKNLKSNDRIWTKSYRQLQRIPKIYAKKAGIEKNVMCHSFRHYFITELRKKRMSWEDIAKVTGHKNISTLSIYDSTDAYLVEDDVRKYVEDL